MESSLEVEGGRGVGAAPASAPVSGHKNNFSNQQSSLGHIRWEEPGASFFFFFFFFEGPTSLVQKPQTKKIQTERIFLLYQNLKRAGLGDGMITYLSLILIQRHGDVRR